MKQRIINYLLRYLLNTVTIDEIITIDKGKIVINGKVVGDDAVRTLKSEVKALEKMQIWALMTGSVKHIAKDKIFNKSTQFSDVTYGRAMLFCVDTIESIARVINKY